MNWLLYIGGGYLWLITIGSLIGTGDNLKSKDITQITIGFMEMFAIISMWIWICWKFV